MRQIKNENLAQLLMQFHFTPQKQRQKQLDEAEKLLVLIENDKSYPFEFVCFRITGFRPKGATGQQLIKGDELAEDLRIFISKLSGQLARPITEQSQKVYTVEKLASVLGVSTKTIHRWRKQDLLARKFIFEDGKKRLSFSQSSVDKFMNDNPELVGKAKNFGRLTNKQKQLIIKRASALLETNATMSRHQIINQIAAETGRAHETIRYTILNYEKAHPEKGVFGKTGGIINPTAAAELYRLFNQGCSVKELMSRFNRSKSSIYRIINRRKARALLARKIEFIASDEFLEEGAKDKILAKPIGVEKPLYPENIEPFELTNELILPKYLQTLKDTPVLNREREVELFRRYNYLKYLACISRAGINPARVLSSRLKEIEDYLAEAETIKKMIIEANLRLVVSIAGKHISSRASFPDLVGKGNFSLVKAVEEFDYTRGFRFATYASWVIAKDYAHEIPAESGRAERTRAASLVNVQRDLRIAEAVNFAAIERARQSLVQVIRDELDEREQYIILNHFGLVGSPVKKKKKTLKQIGDDLKLSKERVRQLELIAIQKLKHSLSIEEFELLTG